MRCNDEPCSSAAELRSLLSGDGYRYGVCELVAVCGNLDALVELGAAPLQVQQEDRRVLTGRAGRLAGIVDDVVADRAEWEVALQFPPRLDDELVLAIRRFLRRPGLEPLLETHGSSDRRLAAALVWIVGRGNGEFGRRARRPAADLWHWFGVSDASAVGRALATELGLLAPERERVPEYPWTPIRLGDASLLTARTRQLVVRQRDIAVNLARADIEHREQSRALRPVGDGRVRISARAVRIETAMKLSVDGRQSVAVFLGGEPDDPEEILSLTIPDAHLLVQCVGSALAGRAATGTSGK